MSRKIACCGLAFTVAITGGCHSKEHEEELPRFEVTTPLRQDTEITREHVCQIRAIRHIEVRALEEGYLQEIFVDEGQHVEEGQRLFQIMPLVYQAELARSAAEVRRAQIELATTRTLREGNVVSENELELARANLERVVAERNLARAHLRFTTLEAPFAGLVGRLHVRRGSLVERGELLTVLSDNSELWVYFNVSEAEYLAYRRANRGEEPPHVRLRMANGELFDQTGVIQTIEAEFNSETGTIAFRAGFPNPDGLLRHGETGEILLTTPLPGALQIPQRATYDVLDRKFVFVVDEDGVVHAREITVSAELPHVYVVAEGLEENDRILLEGLRKVRDGDRIEPVVRDPAEVFATLNVPAE
ncbi:MAG TPA: efflux RND transporter periplasmic adaptor subunit [Sandaracinaceae bacterium]